MTKSDQDAGHRAFGMRVVHQETGWEQSLWPQEKTWHPTLELIEAVAERYGRRPLLDEPDHRFDSPHFIFSKGVDGRTRATFSLVDRRAVTYCHAIHGAVRNCVREAGALIVRQRDVDRGDGKRARTIVVGRSIQGRSVAEQLRCLEAALWSESRYRIEAAYFGLSNAAWLEMSEGLHRARLAGDLAGVSGELEVPAELPGRVILAPDLMRCILPHARRAAARRGRRADDARVATLAVVLGIFVELSGRASGAVRRGDTHGPVGAGADFVRRIEAIFGVQLMPHNSSHAVRRALNRLRQIADRV